MQHLKLTLLALGVLACTALSAQDDLSSPEVGNRLAPEKGSVALGIRLGSASTRYIGRRADGTYANRWGLDPVLGLDLRINRPNNTSHIVGVDFYPESGIVRNFNGTIIGGSPSVTGSYEFRKYRDLPGAPLRAYYGAWVQGSAAAYQTERAGTSMFAEMNLGLSAGLQYDFSKRFFMEGGVRIGLASLSYVRDGYSNNRFGLDGARNLFQAHIGFGIRL